MQFKKKGKKKRRQERTNVLIPVEQSVFNAKSVISNKCPEDDKSPCQATSWSYSLIHQVTMPSVTPF